jgi:hypothetical protein
MFDYESSFQVAAKSPRITQVTFARPFLGEFVQLIALFLVPAQ